MIFSKPAELEHGDRYGKLTVLEQLRNYKGAIRYRVGCECGHSGMVVTVGALTSGRRTACVKCSGNAIANTSA